MTFAPNHATSDTDVGMGTQGEAWAALERRRRDSPAWATVLSALTALHGCGGAHLASTSPCKAITMNTGRLAAFGHSVALLAWYAMRSRHRMPHLHFLWQNTWPLCICSPSGAHCMFRMDRGLLDVVLGRARCHDVSFKAALAILVHFAHLHRAVVVASLGHRVSYAPDCYHS